MQWESKLKALAHIPIKPSQRNSEGFSPVFGYLSPNMMSHELQDFLFISVTVEQKKLPKNKLKRLIVEKFKEVAEQKGKTVAALDKTERQTIQEHVEGDMLKQVAADETYINAFLDTENHLLFIDSSSMSKVETLLKWVDRIDNSFKAKPFFDASLEVYLTVWLNKPAIMPNEMGLYNDAALKHDNSSKAVFTKQELDSEEVKVLINNHKKVIDLGLLFNDRLQFKLNQDGSLRKIKATDLLKSSINYPEQSIDEIETYEAEWLIMCNELSNLYRWMEGQFQVNHQIVQASQKKNDSPPNRNIDAEAHAALDTLQM